MTKMNASRREIISAYEIVMQTYGGGSVVRLVADFLGRPLDRNHNNTFIREVINEYKSSQNQK